MPELPYTLTAHAGRVIAEREIHLEWIHDTITNPMKSEPDPEDRELHHALRRIEEKGGRVLRVIYNKTVRPARIVTAYFDRAQKGRL